MEKLAIPSYSFATKNYCLLTKPGIILGNSVATVGGFVLASKGAFHPFLFMATLLGLGLVIASSCVFNNYIDRVADKKMARTRDRGLATGEISPWGALLFGVVLGFMGTFILGKYTNELTVSLALAGFFIYVILYSFSKYYSLHGTLVGSVAGAIPPVVGYCAVSNHIDAAAWILFAMMVLWQMPHFFAISIYRLDEYRKASIPIFPDKKGMLRTKIESMLYIIGFTAISLMLPIYGYTEKSYAAVAVTLGLGWMWLCAKGFNCPDDKLWARQMFLYSLVIMVGLYIAIPFCI